MTLDRRSVLTGASVAGLAGLGLVPLSSSAQSLRMRKSISTLSSQDPDLIALRRAIPLMKRSGIWNQQIVLHADMSQRHHSSWRFLPWHRLQLSWFEKQVARLSGRANFALPYWDWDDDRVPTLMFNDPVFNLPGRDARQGDSIKAFMARNGRTYTGRITDGFATFFGRPRNSNGSTSGYSGSAEWSGHNMLHGFVGGDMGRLDRSPNDPLFWMHHANIDRIWSLWHQRNTNEIYPKAWRDERFTGFVGLNGRLAPTETAAATLSTASFGYDYAFDPTPPLVFAAAPRREVKRQTFAWAAEILSPGRAVLEIPADAVGGKAAATGFLEVSPDLDRPSVVRITGRSSTDGGEIYSDTVFLVPSAGCESRQGYRITLDGLWQAAGTSAVRLEIESAPLEGRGQNQTGTAILQFILDADVTFLE
jgi:hypothetical protein